MREWRGRVGKTRKMENEKGEGKVRIRKMEKKRIEVRKGAGKRKGEEVLEERKREKYFGKED